MGNTNRCKKFKKAVQKGRNQEQLTLNNISALNSSPASRTINSSEKALEIELFRNFFVVFGICENQSCRGGFRRIRRV